MADRRFRLGTAAIVSKARANSHPIPRQLENIPGGLYPLRMSVWNTDEYRVANGWPVSVPDHDIRARTLVSVEGQVLAYRPLPREIDTTADIRWIADEDFYDLLDLKWRPYTYSSPLAWETSAEYAPTYMDEYEYTRGNEVFIRETLNFDADSFEHMWTDLGAVMGGVGGYSVVMALSTNSSYGGSNTTQQFSGIWCPGHPTPAPGELMYEPPTEGWVSLTLRGSELWLESDQSPNQRVMSVAHLNSTDNPIYLAMVVGRPYTTIYAGRGAQSIQSVQISIGDQFKPFDGRVVLGRTNGSIQHTADLSVMDLNLYTDRLSGSEVRGEISTLAAAYGGAS